MKKIIFKLNAKTIAFACGILVIASVVSISGCQLKKTAVVTPKVIDGFSSPESVIADPVGRYIYVSNVGEKLDPTTKDGDGFISRLSSSGDVLEKKYLPQKGVLDSPKGMAIVGRTLFIADVDRVVGFDLTTRQQTFELDFSSQETTFLNDLAVVDDKTLMVSATDTGKIYKISLEEDLNFTLVVENVAGANGLYFDTRNQRLFVVTFGEGYQFNGKLGVVSQVNGKWKYQALTDTIGGLDGIAPLSDSKIIFSDWVAMDKTGLIRAYDLKTEKLSIINLSQEVNGPADFFYDEKGRNLWLPRMKEGNILVETIK
ncbi:MAG: SMP-30/gluconolactonase/LRE family protein [bacterium]